MIKLYLISATWCKSCPDVYTKITPYIDGLNDNYTFKKLDINDDEDFIEELNIIVNKLPSLLIIENSEKKILIGENIITYFNSMNIQDDDDF